MVKILSKNYVYMFPDFMDDPHKMIAGREFRGTPHEVEGFLVETIGLLVNENRHDPEILSALIAQNESFPCKTEGNFIPNGEWES